MAQHFSLKESDSAVYSDQQLIANICCPGVKPVYDFYKSAAVRRLVQFMRLLQSAVS